ncbi:MAG: hypothetical protein PHH70_05550 [Candidatus Gracilibacteria bacterium]|nr:hypothetical protein [Candidatus Gracilibacteria bacterium]
MEMMDKRKKDRLIKGIVLNSFVLIGCAIYVFTFVEPKYTALGDSVAKINTLNGEITSLQNTGVNADSFQELLNRLGRMQEVSENIFSDPSKLTQVLTKPANIQKDYLSWLIDENGKVNDMDKEIGTNDRILGNIIPVFSNDGLSGNDSDVENQITLGSFISYIENNILGKYMLSSYVPLGISNITFPDKKDTPVNIGSFKVALDFKGKNSDIKSFLTNIQQSGKITIQNGKLTSTSPLDGGATGEKGLSSLSNLLINIDSLSLDTIPIDPNEQNNGSITLVFYVEGLNYQKILAIRTLLLAKFAGLQKSVQEKGMLCAKAGNPLCDESVTNNAITAIKVLMNNLSMLQPKIDALKKGDATIDVNKEMETLSDIKSSLQSIEIAYLKNNAIIEKVKKQSSTK